MITPTTRAKPGTDNFVTAAKNAKFSDKNYQAPAFPSRPLHESLCLFFPRKAAKPQRIARITEEPISHQLPTPIFLGALGDLAVQHFHHPDRFSQAKIKSNPPRRVPSRPLHESLCLFFPRKAAKPQGSQKNPSPISFQHLSSLALLATWRFNIFIIPTDFPKQR